MKAILFIGLGSFAGGVLRHMLGCYIQRFTDGGFPWHTLLINLAACLLLGALTAFAERGFALSHEMRLALCVGLCGGFSTFSTFAMENVKLLQGSSLLPALLYTAASLIGGLLLFALGYGALRAL